MTVENPVTIPLTCNALAENRLEQVSVDSHGSFVNIYDVSFPYGKIIWEVMTIHVLSERGTSSRHAIDKEQLVSERTGEVRDTCHGSQIFHSIYVSGLHSIGGTVCVVLSFAWINMCMYFLFLVLENLLCFGQFILFFVCWAEFYDCFSTDVFGFCNISV